MADVSFQVTERRRVVDINDETTFNVKITNSGTKEATKILVNGTYSENLQPLGNEKDPNDKDSNEQMKANPQTHELRFLPIASLGPGKSKVLSVRVKAIGPGFAMGEFSVMHDDLPEKVKLKGMATFRVTDNVKR